MKVLFIFISSLISISTASEVRIIYEQPRKVAAVWASVKEDKSMIGYFETFQPKDQEGHMRGAEFLCLTLSRGERPIDISSSREISGPSELSPEHVSQLIDDELVRRIDCFEDKDGIDLYVFQAAKVTRITFHRNGSTSSKLFDVKSVPKMESPVLLTLPANADIPVFTIK